MTAGPTETVYFVNRGATFRSTITWNDHDLNNYALLMQVRDGDDLKLELGTEIDVGGITANPDGSATIELLPDETREMVVGAWPFDLLAQNKTDTDEVFKLLAGTWRVLSTVTSRSPLE